MSWKPYTATDRHSVELPSQIFNILNSGEFVPEPRTKFAAVLQKLEIGQYITLPNLGQEPKHFALGYHGRRLFITQQMIDIWNLLSTDSTNSIKRVLSGPMGVGKSYLALFLVAKAYSEGWLTLYISDAAELIQPTVEMSSEEICKRFLAMNKDILTAAELKQLVAYAGVGDIFASCAGVIWGLFKQKNRKTLLVVDEHGTLFDVDPPVPDRLYNLQPLKVLTFWGELASGSRVILTGTAHAKFEKNYLINGMHAWWIEYVCPLTEEVFDNLLNLHPILGKLSVAPKVKKIVNCVPRELIYFSEYVKDLAPDDEKIDILLKLFRNHRHDAFLEVARNYLRTLDYGTRMDYRRSLSNMFLRSSDIKINVSFDWKFLDTGLVYRFKGQYNRVMFRPLCPAALDALLDVYCTFPLPKDVSVTSLRDGNLTGDKFEEILFQQLLNHRNVILDATDLCGNPVKNVQIKFEHFFVLEKDQFAPEPQHGNSLIRGYACYPRFDFMIGYLFIQVSISPFDKHNKESANINKAFERYRDDPRNQIELYLDTTFGAQHTALYQNGKFHVLKDYIPIEDFRIVYMCGSPSSPNHSRLVNKYQDVAFISYEEIKTKLFGDFLKN